MTEPFNMIAFPQLDAKVWIESYQQDCLMQKDEATVDAYVRILRQFTAWVAKLPGQGGQFVPSQLTATAVERYLSVLKEQGYSVSHRTRVKTVISGFCRWLIEEKLLLKLRLDLRRILQSYFDLHTHRVLVLLRVNLFHLPDRSRQVCARLVEAI